MFVFFMFSWECSYSRLEKKEKKGEQLFKSPHLSWLDNTAGGFEHMLFYVRNNVRRRVTYEVRASTLRTVSAGMVRSFCHGHGARYRFQE